LAANGQTTERGDRAGRSTNYFCITEIITADKVEKENYSTKLENFQLAVKIF
jgi:hypothetical protein